MHLLALEFKQIENVLLYANSNEDDELAVRHFTEKIMQVDDLNSDLRAELDRVESAIENLNKNTFLENEVRYEEKKIKFSFQKTHLLKLQCSIFNEHKIDENTITAP